MCGLGMRLSDAKSYFSSVNVLTPPPPFSAPESRHVGLSAQFPSPLSPDSNSSHSVSEAPILEEEEEDIFTNIVPYSRC